MRSAGILKAHLAAAFHLMLRLCLAEGIDAAGRRPDTTGQVGSPKLPTRHDPPIFIMSTHQKVRPARSLVSGVLWADLSTKACLIHQHNMCKRLKVDAYMGPKRLFTTAASRSSNSHFNFKYFGQPAEPGEAMLAHVRALKHPTSISTYHLYTSKFSNASLT